jgi:hypothetical protein
MRFEIDRFMPDAAHCHCSMCRKFHGSEFATLATVHRTDFRWTSGSEKLQSFTASNGVTRSFCSRCGSSLTFRSPKSPEDQIDVALGTMDGDVPIRPSAHIFVGSAARWSKISDDLPQYDKHRDTSTPNR